MLPTSVINPNTNLLFPSTSNRSEEERVEIVGIVVQTTFEEIEERISRVLFFAMFFDRSFPKSLHAIRKYASNSKNNGNHRPQFQKCTRTTRVIIMINF